MIYFSYHLYKITVNKLPEKSLHSSIEEGHRTGGSLKLSTKGRGVLDPGMTASLWGQLRFTPPINIWISVSWDPFPVLRQRVSQQEKRQQVRSPRHTPEEQKDTCSVTSERIQTSEANVENCHRWTKTSQRHAQPRLSSSMVEGRFLKCRWKGISYSHVKDSLFEDRTSQPVSDALKWHLSRSLNFLCLYLKGWLTIARQSARPSIYVAFRYKWNQMER